MEEALLTLSRSLPLMAVSAFLGGLFLGFFLGGRAGYYQGLSKGREELIDSLNEEVSFSRSLIPENPENDPAHTSQVTT